MFSIKRRWPNSNPNHRRITGNSVDRYRKFNYSLVCKLILLLLMLAPIVPIMAQQPPSLVQVDQTQGENQIVSLQSDQELVVALEYNPSTGQTVKLQNLARLPVQLVKRVIKLNSDLIGAPATLNLHFKGKWAGAAQLNFLSCRPWEECELPLKQLTVNLQTVGSFPTPAPQADNLFAANALADVMEIPVKEEVVIGYKRPHESKSSNNDFQSSSAEAPSLESNLSLPASFNWCDHGGCTPIKDQGSCGSCWAFSTVGPLESNILMKTGQTKDLAEQYLISCNSNGWNCAKGGGFAHDYHWKKKISGEPDAGAVYESDFPYKAADAGCNPPHTHHEKLTSWSYVSNSRSVPSTDAIKQAIQTYGPVSAGVCVGSKFQSYKSGIFSTDETSSCGGGTNHAIVLVGWDDSQGVWILRNSWGPRWGEQGYMRIKYGVSKVGDAANYVSFSGSNSTYTLTVSKAGNGSGTVTSNPAGINCGADCSEAYASGTVVTLTATPANGTTFAGWSGACSGTGTCQVTMSQARAVTATFSAPNSTYTLTVSKAGNGSGTVTSNPAGINCGADCSEAYASGTVVTLTARPARGSRFAGWSGACSGTGTCQVTMSQARTVTASFRSIWRLNLINTD